MHDIKYEYHGNIIVIKPENFKVNILDCEICGFALRHQEDLIEHKRFGCCSDCSLHFRQPNLKKWLEGWRPSRKEVEKVIIRDVKGEF